MYTAPIPTPLQPPNSGQSSSPPRQTQQQALHSSYFIPTNDISNMIPVPPSTNLGPNVLGSSLQPLPSRSQQGSSSQTNPQLNRAYPASNFITISSDPNPNPKPSSPPSMYSSSTSNPSTNIMNPAPSFVPTPPSMPSFPTSTMTTTTSSSSAYQLPQMQPLSAPFPSSTNMYSTYGQPAPPSQSAHPSSSSFYPPDALSSLMNDPRAQLGVQLGSKAFQVGQEYMNENIHRYINVPHLKYYFQVTRGYVFKKLRILLFPFRQTHWYRMSKPSPESNGNNSGRPSHDYRPPKEDMHAPDLYIPTMGFVTYVFLVNLESGVRTGFHPELLGVTSSKAFFAILSEVLLVKLGCYLFSVQTTVPILDLIAYAGYKFVGIIVTLLISFPVFFTWLPYWVFWITLGYTSLALGFFSLRSMRYIVIPEPNTTATMHLPQRRRRINFLAAVVGLQILTSWLLVK